MGIVKVLLSVSLLIVLMTTQSEGGSLFGSDTLVRPSRSYDVLHYRISVRFEREQRKVFGSTTITCVPLGSKLDSVVLHAGDLDVTAVLLEGKRSLRYSNDRKTLSVHLGRPYSFRDTIKLLIEYTAVPKQGLYFLAPDSSDRKRHDQIWSQGEDMDNRYWFPCWDFPNDKATSEVIATVAESWSVLSNGRLIDVRHDKKTKTKTFHWMQPQPHASYLIMIAAGEYEVINDKFEGIPLQYYVYKDRVDDGRRSFAPTREVMRFFKETLRYPYPWETFSQIFIDDFMWGGMENTSAVTYNTSYLLDRRAMVDFTSTEVIAHELAHQWFGDLVTARDWTELWLNEGFANYYESLHKKYSLGYDEFLLDLKSQADAVLGVERGQGRRPVVSQDSYTTNLYSKGAWVLHMLNNLLGDQEFHRAVDMYLHRNAFGSVSTHDFAKAVEEATGQNMDWFFQQWLYKAGHPQLHITSSWNDTTKNLRVVIRQTQTLDSLTGLFTFPLDIECTTSSGKTLTKVWITRAENVVSISLPERPLLIIVDKGRKILKSLKQDKSKEEWVYQLLHAEDGVDRLAAARPLKEYPDDGVVYAALRQSAQTDPFWAVRREATIYLGTMAQPGVKEAMFEIYKDKKSSVRNAAIVALEKFKTSDVAEFLRNAMAVDSSYLVQAACLTALEEVDSIAALSAALDLVDRDSYRDILRRSALHVLRSQKVAAVLGPARKYAALGNPRDIRATALTIIRDTGENDSASRTLVLELTTDADATIRKSAVQTLGMWGGPDAINVLERRKSDESDSEVRDVIKSALEEALEK